MIIFFSDNGGLSTGSGPNSPTSSFPLKGGKSWLYEGGIRVPLIIKLPGKVKAGLKINEPVIGTDLYPTILDLLELPLMPHQHKDGESLKALVNGTQKRTDRDAVYFHYPHYHHINSMGPSGAIRIGKYKLIEVFETGNVELYNLEKDLGETVDLSNSQPLLTKKILKKLKNWQKQSGVSMPTPNPDYIKDKDFRIK